MNANELPRNLTDRVKGKHAYLFSEGGWAAHGRMTGNVMPPRAGLPFSGVVDVNARGGLDYFFARHNPWHKVKRVARKIFTIQCPGDTKGST